MANMPASVQTDLISAPVLLGHNLASSSYRMSRSTDIDRAWIRKMLIRPSWSGRPNSTFRSRRPGRRRAGSRVSGLLVAIKTLMLPRGSKPSNWKYKKFVSCNFICSNHLNTGLVWYSNGRFVSCCQMVRYSNGGVKTRLNKHVYDPKYLVFKWYTK